MFQIEWCDTERHYECCAPDNKSAWMIYWALKKHYEKRQLEWREGAWITIWCRVFCDPRKGSSFPMVPEGEDPHIPFVEPEGAKQDVSSV